VAISEKSGKIAPALAKLPTTSLAQDAGLRLGFQPLPVKEAPTQCNRIWIVLKGHGFSRAAKQPENLWASHAAEKLVMRQNNSVLYQGTTSAVP
jgi:hypothetical protein